MQDDHDQPSTMTEQAFIALQQARGLAPSKTESRAVTFADILHYVLGKTDIDLERVAKAINSQLAHRRTYQALLTQNRKAFAPQEAHAQDGQLVDLRNGDDFKIKLRSSRARPEQVYVILEVAYPQQFIADKPVILHIVAEQSHNRLDFPPLVDGQSQFILAEQDSRLLALRDINSELNLV